MFEFNWLAVIAATFSSFVLGAKTVRRTRVWQGLDAGKQLR